MARKIRGLAESFYGRVGAYEDALAEGADGDALSEALARNVYGDEDALKAKPLADYVRETAASIDAQPLESLADGKVSFGAAITS